jgi:hypothetical protein
MSDLHFLRSGHRTATLGKPTLLVSNQAGLIMRARINRFAALLMTFLFLHTPADLLRAKQTNQVGPELLLPVAMEERHGFIDLNGRIVIPPRFENARGFFESRAAVRLNGRYGFIDRSGQFVISPRFDDAIAFREGLAQVRLGDLWGFVGTDGQVVIQPQFQVTHWFSEGRAAVAVQVDGRFGYIDKLGTYVIPPRYQMVSDFEDGRASAWMDGKEFVIDKDGRPIAGNPNVLIPQKLRGKWGFTTPEGEVAVDFRFEAVYRFSEGLAAVQVGKRWGFIDESGQLVIATQFEDACAKTAPDSGCGSPSIGSFKEGVAAVYEAGSWRFIDRSGRIAIPGHFSKVAPSGFKNGVVSVCGTKSCGYIDKTGRVIWPWG